MEGTKKLMLYVIIIKVYLNQLLSLAKRWEWLTLE